MQQGIVCNGHASRPGVEWHQPEDVSGWWKLSFCACWLIITGTPSVPGLSQVISTFKVDGISPAFAYCHHH